MVPTQLTCWDWEYSRYGEQEDFAKQFVCCWQGKRRYKEQGGSSASSEGYLVKLVRAYFSTSGVHTRREGYRHRMETQHLTKGHLLTSLNRLSLDQ